MQLSISIQPPIDIMTPSHSYQKGWIVSGKTMDTFGAVEVTRISEQLQVAIAETVIVLYKAVHGSLPEPYQKHE